MGHMGSAWDAATGVWLDWMTRMSWQVAVLVAVVLAISLLARKASARFRYLLWCLVLLKLCLPPGIAFVTGIGQWFPVMPEAPLQTSTMEALPAPAPDEFLPGPSFAPAPFAEAPAALPHSPHVSWPRALFGIWLVGLLGMMGLLARQYVRLRRHLSGGAPVEDPQVLDAFRQAREATGVGSRVRLLTSAGLSSPILVGLVRPRIMLPAGALEDLLPDQLRPVLLHELAHLRRRDLWVNWVQVILQSLYWFHPLVWLANLRLRREREMIVDDVVLSHLGDEREVYGNSLLSVVKQAARKRVLSPGYVGIAETPGSIAGRLRRILDANRKLSVRLGWLSALVLIGLAFLLIPQARPNLEAAAAVGNDDLSAIVARVRERQDRVKLLEYVWTSKTLLPKYCFLGRKYPPEDMYIESAMNLLIDGQNIRCDVKNMGWSSIDNQWFPAGLSTAFVDGVERTHFVHSNRGRIGRDKWAAKMLNGFPVLFAYRLFDPVLSQADPSQVRIVGRAVHDGHECVIIEKPGTDDRQRWWLAIDQEYCPVFWESPRDKEGSLGATASMQYEEDEKVGWRLKSWTLARRSDSPSGVPRQTTLVAVDSHFNEPLEPDAFEIVFPPGTEVVDKVMGVEYTVGENPLTQVELEAMARQQAAEREKRERKRVEKLESAVEKALGGE